MEQKVIDVAATDRLIDQSLAASLAVASIDHHHPTNSRLDHHHHHHHYDPSTHSSIGTTTPLIIQEAMADELFDLRNHFYLKNYQAGINEGSSVRPTTPAATLERDVLVYRCFVGLGNNKMVRIRLTTLLHYVKCGS